MEKKFPAKTHFALICYLIVFFITSTTDLAVGQVKVATGKIQKLKRSTVQIFVNNKPVGSGFFISDEGDVLTNWHVINSAVFFDSLKNVKLAKVKLKTITGSSYELDFYSFYLRKGNNEARIFDYCLLRVSRELQAKFKKEMDAFKLSFLKLGRFEDAEEGDIIYTCGYPFGINSQFVSKGILSTKFKEEFLVIDKSNFSQRKILVNKAWSDLTSNKGNSGGPIILHRPNGEDVVIGINTFICNPNLGVINILTNQSKGLQKEQIEINKILAKALFNNSVGMSGFVSIDYFNLTYSQE